MRRSWEHRRFLSILFLSSLLFVPLLPRARRVYIQKAVTTGLSMRFGFIGSCPLDLVPLFILSPLHAHLFLSSFLSCLPVFTSGHLIPSFICARIGPGLSMYAHIQIRFKPRSARSRKRGGADLLFLWFPFRPNRVNFCPILSSFLMSSSFLSLLRAHMHSRLILPP